MQTQKVVNDIRDASRRLVRELGFMQPTLAETDLPPSAVHALIEIGEADSLTASDLSARLRLEKSSVSRMLARLEACGEIAVRATRSDGRVKSLRLTPKGRRTLAAIDRFANRRVSTALGKVADPVKVRDGLSAYARALAGESDHAAVAYHAGYTPGLIGCCATMHSRYYAREFGLGPVFERRVAAEFAEFAGRLDNPVNGTWCAVLDGEIVGTVAIDGEDMGADVAHLRWFIVGDGLRGLGVGRALLGLALAHCDALGRETKLWTFRGLDSARHLYEQNGFRLAHEAAGTQWGSQVMEQMFERPALGAS